MKILSCALLLLFLFLAPLAAQVPDRKVDLFWDDPNPAQNQVVEYVVYRGTQTGGPYTEVGRSSVKTFADFVPPGIFWYVVTAVNAGGESGDSNEVGTVPLALLNLRIVITLQVVVP